MNQQEIIVALLFALAIVYIARMLFNTVSAKKSCGQNCKCGVDFSNVELPKEK